MGNENVNPPRREKFTLATAADYSERYGDPDDALAQLLEEQLARASRIVRDELAASGYDIEEMISSGRVHADTAADVVCDMVNYAARTAGGVAGLLAPPLGASQASMTAGPFSQSASFSAPVGSMSLTRVHRKRLGLPLQRAFEVDLLAGRGRR